MSNDQRRSLVEWLGRKVMGWEGEIGHWEIDWPFAGMVWERAREMGIMLSLVGDSTGWSVDDGESLDFVAGGPSGPLAISLAIARATGWEGGEDA